MRSFFAEASFETKDGERLHLVCDFYTIQVVEDITGRDWDEIVPELVGSGRTLKIMVLYGLLRKRHPGITLDEATAITYDVDEGALGALMGAIIAKAQNPGADEEASEEKAPAKKKSGGRSRASAKSG